MRKVATGDAGPPFEVGPITRTDLVRYAGAAGDFNPLHHDDDYARSLGNPSVFAHGMFSGGLLASFVVRWFGPRSVRRIAIRFREPVWPGDVLKASGEVIGVAGEGAARHAKLEIRLTRQSGDVVVSGEAEALLEPPT
jgi:acyl dehydratase